MGRLVLIIVVVYELDNLVSGCRQLVCVYCVVDVGDVLSRAIVLLLVPVAGLRALLVEKKLLLAWFRLTL